MQVYETGIVYSFFYEMLTVNYFVGLLCEKKHDIITSLYKFSHLVN